MSLTPEQREAAVIEALTGIAGPLRTRHILRRLESVGFLVLHRDDVTEDHKIKWGGEDGCEPIRTSKRLITRWEPITTKEDNDA